jgi:potassium efflux system protein
VASTPEQPRKDEKDLLTRLADAGEDAINRLSDLPGGSRLSDAAHTMRARMDELQKKVRGIDDLERRIAALEARVDELSKPAKPRAARSATPAPKPPTTSGP